MVKSYRDLRAWQASMDLVEMVYQMTRPFPKHETYALCSQMQRAAVSIPSNIAEGHTREHIKEYLHHLSMSQASIAELETQFEIATRLDYISREQFNQAFDFTQSLGRQLRSLRKSLAEAQNNPAPRT
jgi:four helix bundle protein